ncbi:Uncharacterised protein [Shigella flexneri]|nr:Uncharacterised protein [Shigella flexneri]
MQLRFLIVKLKQCAWVDANHTVDDKFQTRKAHAFARQAGEVESTVRVTDVHHHFQRQIRHRFYAGAFHAKFQQLRIDVTGITFGTRNSDVLTVFHPFCCISTAHYRRNAQFTSDDRRVTGTTATVGDDGRCFLHDRFPVRVGHVSNQHVARFDAVHFADVMDDFHRTRADAMTDSTAFGDNLTL